MSHPERRDLALWAGGDLPAGEAERIAEHLSACSSCRALADGLRASREGLEALGAEPVDPAALARIRARIRDGLRRRLEAEEPRRPSWPWALAASLALTALGLGIWYRTAGTGDPERLAHAERPEPVEVRQAAPPPPPETPAELAETPSESPGEPATPWPPGPEPAGSPNEAAPPPPEPTAPVQRAALPPEPEGPTQTTVIKVVSDDPDIVYYWLVEPEENRDETVSS